MLCPACKDVNLSMTDRQGIEIDYCPSCRGIWLDRGELDRLIERAERPPSPARPAPSRPDYPPPHRGEHDRGHSHHEHRPKRHKSLLGELFDF